MYLRWTVWCLEILCLLYLSISPSKGEDSWNQHTICKRYLPHCCFYTHTSNAPPTHHSLHSVNSHAFSKLTLRVKKYWNTNPACILIINLNHKHQAHIKLKMAFIGNPPDKEGGHFHRHPDRWYSCKSTTRPRIRQKQVRLANSPVSSTMQHFNRTIEQLVQWKESIHGQF